jgi:hypothetical protein
MGALSAELANTLATFHTTRALAPEFVGYAGDMASVFLAVGEVRNPSPAAAQ